MAEHAGIKPESIETIRAYIAGKLEAEARVIDRGHVEPIGAPQMAGLLECADRLGLRLEGARVADLTARLAAAEDVARAAEGLCAVIKASSLTDDDFHGPLERLVPWINAIDENLKAMA